MPENGSRKGDYLYLSIYKELKGEILQGKYVKGDAFPPERVLKERFETTHVTVRNALSLLVEEGYIERYSGKGTVVVFSPDLNPPHESRPLPPAGEAGDRGRFFKVRLLLSSPDEQSTLLLSELERACRARQASLEISFYHGDSRLERELLQDDSPGNLLIYAPSRRESRKLLPPSAAGRTLLLGFPGESDSEGSASEAALPEIQLDFPLGGRECVTFLNRIGYKKIAFIGEEGSLRGKSLEQGYLQALAEQGLSSSPDLRAEGLGLSEGGYDACRRILSAHPDCRAFLCASDLSAGGVLKRLAGEGLAAEKDFTVVGCGNHPFAEVLGLSSLELHTGRTGTILRSLIDEFSHARRLGPGIYRVKPELVLRRCGRI